MKIDAVIEFMAHFKVKNPTSEYELKKFDKLIGIKNIGLIHLNDSAKDLESHVDRHATIGKGFIGEDSIKEIFLWATDSNIDIILETGGAEREIPMLLKFKKNHKNVAKLFVC